MFKRYRRTTLVLFFLSISFAVFSQNIGISTLGTTPDINAILDLNSGNSRNLGLIIPNVSLSAPATFDPPIANANTLNDIGMMVYNTNATFSNGIGYYYWNGIDWISAGGSGGGGNVNACVTAATGYIPYFTSATTICNSVIYQAGTTAVGVGTANPQNMLDVKGAMAVGTYAGTNTAPAGGIIVSGQTGIGTNTPDASAVLDVTSTTQGFLVPRIANPSTIVNPYNGLIVYNTTTSCLEYYLLSATAWINMSCPCNVPLGTVGAITGPSNLCNLTVGTYTLAAVSGATSYTWSSSNTNIASLTSANGGTSATFTGGATVGSFTITVSVSNNCTTSNQTIVGYNGAPTGTPTVVGNTTPVLSTAYTYTCATVTGATGYTWSTSNTSYGTVTASAANSCTVTTTASVGTFNICVTPTNACGSGPQGCLSVTSTSCTPNIQFDASSTFTQESSTVQITTTHSPDLVLVMVNGFGTAKFTGSISVNGGAVANSTVIASNANDGTSY